VTPTLVSSANPLPVEDTGAGTPSTSNASTTLLTNGNAYTGTWEDVSAYDSLTIAVATDQDGTYSVQFSPDGSNVDSTLTRYYRTAFINPPHRFTITRRYARVVFTNDSGADQTYFRLQLLLGAKQPLNVPIDGTISRDYDATVVRPTAFFDEVALGLRQGHTAFLKFGFNEDVDTGTEVVAAFGGTFTPLASAETMDVVSSSTDDDGDPAGIGAQTLLISGIDGSRKEQSEVVTMNGTTTVTTANSWLGINRIVVLAAGTSQGNVGNISVTATTATTNQAYIPAGDSVTQQCIYFTPAGHNALIHSIFINVLKISGGASPRCTIKLRVWNPGVTNAIYTLRRVQIDTSVSNVVTKTFDVPLLLSPTDVAWLECTTSTDNTVIDAAMNMIQYRQAAT